LEVFACMNDACVHIDGYAAILVGTASLDPTTNHQRLRDIMAMASVKSTRPKRVMKAKRVSKIARGRSAKLMVFRGKYEKTSGGVRADGLMKNKLGKVVSKSKSAWTRRVLKNWTDSVMSARQLLNLEGFVAINGNSLEGKALYLKAKAAYEERRHEKA